MARVADYSVIADNWVVEFDQDTINFGIPSTIDSESRCILGFMLKVSNLEAMTLNIRLNGHKVWTWHADGDTDLPIRFFQEVISGGIVRAGTNVFQFDSESSDFTFVKLSDIVVWWQATI